MARESSGPLTAILRSLGQFPGRMSSRSSFHRKRHVLPYALVATALSLLLLGLRPPILNEANQVARDRIFHWRTPPAPPDNVVVVAIDQASVDTLGRWPWSRRLQARLIRNLKLAGVGTIALDITYLHPESAEADTALMEVLQAGGAPVVGGYFFRNQATDPSQQPTDQRMRLEAIHSLTPTAANLDISDILRQATFSFPYIEVVQSEIARYLAAMGFFNILPERDGRIRKLPLVVRHGQPLGGERYLPSLTLQALAIYLSPHRDIPCDPEFDDCVIFPAAIDLRVGHEGIAAIQLGDRPIPVDHHGQFTLNFYRPHGEVDPTPTSPTGGIIQHNHTGLAFISATTVLQAQDPEVLQNLRQVLAGKLVFVGLTEQGIADFQPTPVAQQFPGVAVHATAAANILAGQYLTDGSDALLVTVLLTALLPSLTVLVLSWIERPIIMASVAIGALLLPLGWFLYMAFQHHTLLGFVYPSVGVVLAIFSFSAYHVRTAREQTRYLIHSFGKFLSEELVHDFLHDERWRDLNPNQEPELREITVLFSDVRDFTSISEQLGSANTLFTLLNRYLGEMASIVKHHNGHLDKFIGDAVMAIYNAPVFQAQHAAQGAMTALQMQQRLGEIRGEFMDQYGVELRIGIGLHTGEASVGNVGNERHLEYTALGDTVNQAARLEGSTKLYGVEILITSDTRAQLPDNFLCRELDTVIFKGKQTATTIHELMGVDPNPDQQTLAATYEAALALYRQGSFTEALAMFSAIIRNPAHQHDKPSLLMMERCRVFQTMPPIDWDGTTRLEEK